ncbi:MAG: glycosyltransferase involved in cell wall biosynthesis [Verrucomicrobiales bacterium]|jgi:glycosyltransferase involved in cell wall biosynthesis
MTAAYPLSIPVITCNEEENLKRCLASVASLDAEIIVVDSGSTDGTRSVADSFGARWSTQEWLGFRDQKNVALGLCTQPWVLALDADEEVSPELMRSIIKFFEDGNAERYVGGYCARKVWFLGRWITHGDWYPDHKLRLFRRDAGTWGGSPEHDKIELNGARLKLAGDLHHYSFPSINRYIEKINVFSDVYLERQLATGKNWSLAHNLFRPFWRFIRCYFIRRGFLDGFPGLWIAMGIAFQAFVRHSRTYEVEHQQKSNY